MSERTILVTGANGYIAQHLLVLLLEDGWNVRGTVRSEAKKEHVREAVKPALKDPALLNNLTLLVLDLTQDEGWAEACQGVQTVAHTASPFPMTPPKDEQDLIRPAVQGTTRVLNAALQAKVPHCIVTSSTAAVTRAKLPPDRSTYDERDWTDPDDPSVSAYIRSKTLAEKAAWSFAKAHPDLALTVINPGFVQGPPLGERYGTSLQIIERILKAELPMLPDTAFSVVDVRDVARLHLLAANDSRSHGQRMLAVSKTMDFLELTLAIRQIASDRKLTTRVAPHWLMRIVSWFDPSVRPLLPELGKRPQASNQAAAALGATFRDPEQSVQQAAQYLIERGV